MEKQGALISDIWGERVPRVVQISSSLVSSEIAVEGCTGSFIGGA